MGQDKLAMMISGPLAWTNLRQRGIDFGVAPMAGVNGKLGRPFIGVMAACLNRTKIWPRSFWSIPYLPRKGSAR